MPVVTFFAAYGEFAPFSTFFAESALVLSARQDFQRKSKKI